MQMYFVIVSDISSLNILYSSENKSYPEMKYYLPKQYICNCIVKYSLRIFERLLNNIPVVFLLHL